ncbi:hypothetical protein WL08_12130 [Burkholderia ubonensis]|nr:hypothetical protein WK51_00515 [Burkholderia ubonensis]KVX80949.1 hypothetical protein WL08_12130 [Burkholderia ubonensis]
MAREWGAPKGAFTPTILTQWTSSIFRGLILREAVSIYFACKVRRVNSYVHFMKAETVTESFDSSARFVSSSKPR